MKKSIKPVRKKFKSLIGAFLLILAVIIAIGAVSEKRNSDNGDNMIATEQEINTEISNDSNISEKEEFAEENIVNESLVNNSEMSELVNDADELSNTENKVTLYAADGRTTEVFESEADAYCKVGWYRTLGETRQTMYAPDGRTITVYKSEVPTYKNVGWYETQLKASEANKTTKHASSSNNPSPDGNYYRTPTGKRYHLDPNCGGKNSYKTNDISGLSPCAKCAK